MKRNWTSGACVAALMAGLLLSGCAPAGTTTTATTSIRVGAGQTLVIGRITEIKGNDLVLALARETTVSAGQAGSGTRGTGAGAATGGVTQSAGSTTQSAGSGTQSSSDATSASGQQGGQRQRPSGMDQGGQSLPSGQSMPSGQGGQRQRPSGMDQGGQYGQPTGAGQSAVTGQSAAGGQTTGSGQAVPGGQTAATGQAGSGRTTGSGTSASQPSAIFYALTGETMAARIPVGVKVTTAKGAVTTFSRLAVGDMVKLLMEDSGGAQTPVAVWIVG